MNTDLAIRQFLASVSKAFPFHAQRDRDVANIYFHDLEKALRQVRLDRLAERLRKECDEFPTIKKILETAAAQKAANRKDFAGGPTEKQDQTDGNSIFKKLGFVDFRDFLNNKTKTMNQSGSKKGERCGKCNETRTFVDDTRDQK